MAPCMAPRLPAAVLTLLVLSAPAFPGPPPGAGESGPLAPQRGVLYAAAFSPDGKLLATAESPYRITLWDPATLRWLGELEGRGPLAFSPDGKLLVSGALDKFLRVWDVSSRKELCRLSAPAFARCLAFAPG